jgi:hypothetical protein
VAANGSPDDPKANPVLILVFLIVCRFAPGNGAQRTMTIGPGMSGQVIRMVAVA